MVITGRPRAHSASSIKFNLVSPHSKLDRGTAHSTPELRSMLVELETTVPQNLVPPNFSNCHRPRPARRKKRRQRDVDTGRCCCCGCCRCCRCCRIHILLVILQVLIGSGITALSFYLEFYLPVIRARERPYWAGIPLCIAGVSGIYYCATNFTSFSGTRKAFVTKAVCLFFSVLAIFLCIIATTFPVIHLSRIFTFATCRLSNNNCLCSMTADFESRVFEYFEVEDCHVVQEEVRLYLLIMGGLCLLGFIISLWFVILVWQARYGKFYSGLRRQQSLKNYMR
ncbi:sarcospan-like [Haliotis asinina]|uniref:sarcospan-like n=1 Tax=Haliotis asinina TaxID=109174 RepID=UPI003531B4B9